MYHLSNMEELLLPLVSIIVAAFAGAGLNHVLGRRAESLRALREARTSWAVETRTYRDNAQKAMVEGEGPTTHDLTIDPVLSVLDPEGSGLVRTMVVVHTSAEARVSSEWTGTSGPVRSVLPPQIVKIGQSLDQTVALWAQANWRMPLWRLRLRCRCQVRREKLWTYFMHGELVSQISRSRYRDDVRRFRRYAREIKTNFSAAQRKNKLMSKRS